MCDGLNGATEI